MKQLMRRPFLCGLLLSLPLWLFFDNYIIAISVALISTFTLSMALSLREMEKDDE